MAKALAVEDLELRMSPDIPDSGVQSADRELAEILEALAADADDMPVAYMNVCVACTEDYGA